MSQVVPLHSTLPAMAFTGPQLELIKKTVASDTNQDEFNLFIEVAKFRGLNPFLRQIYAVVYCKDDPKKRKMSIITGIDGFRIIASRCRDYRPDESPPIFEIDPAKKGPSNPEGIVKCVVRCFKLGPDKQWYPVAGEAYWDEFAPLKEVDEAFEWVDTGETWPDSGKPKKTRRRKQGDFALVPDGKWATMPRVMLSKCAESICLRKGWPEDFSGVYVAEEMDRARIEDMTATDAIEEYARDRRLHLTRANDSICVLWDVTRPLEAIPVGQFADEVLKRLPTFKSAADLAGWKETNAVALNHFWARAKPDALELKKKIEEREAELRSGAAA